MRLFIGITLNKRLEKKITFIQNSVKSNIESKNLKVKWVAPEKVHLTLKFLGNSKKNKLLQIKSYLHQAVRKINPFKIEFDCTGIFPKPSRPRILWIGSRKIPNNLKILKKRIDVYMEKVGYNSEAQRYIPHLTLGRIKKYSKKSKLVSKFQSISFKPEILTVNRVKLIRSKLKSDGPQYSIIENVKFC